MLYPSITELMKKAGNRYSLVIASSKRARQISEDALEKERSIDGAKSISEAIVEIAEGKVEIINYKPHHHAEPAEDFYDMAEIEQKTDHELIQE